NRVLREFDCRARSGDVTLLIGPNGAGKSTALKIAGGALAPDSGSVRIDGVDLRVARRRAQALAASLPRTVSFPPRLSVVDTLEFYADLRGAPRGRVDDEIARWGLDAHADKLTGQLSGGLRQRLGLAVLMLPDSPAMLLDEPGVSLDPEWRERMQRILLKEARRGRTGLVATHLLGARAGRASRCIVCKQGRAARDSEPGWLRREVA